MRALAFLIPSLLLAATPALAAKPTVGLGGGYDIDITGVPISADATALSTRFCALFPVTCPTVPPANGGAGGGGGGVTAGVLLRVPVIVEGGGQYEALLELLPGSDGVTAMQLISAAPTDDLGQEPAQYWPALGWGVIPGVVLEGQRYTLTVQSVGGEPPAFVVVDARPQ